MVVLVLVVVGISPVMEFAELKDGQAGSCCPVLEEMLYQVGKFEQFCFCPCRHKGTSEEQCEENMSSGFFHSGGKGSEFMPNQSSVFFQKIFSTTSAGKSDSSMNCPMVKSPKGKG